MSYNIGKIFRPENGDNESGFATTTLTATLKKGEAIMKKTFTVRVREQGISDDQAVAFDKASLSIPGFDNIKATFITLVSEGENGTVITWKSSDAKVISDAGLVTRPNNGETEAKVTMTATIAKGSTTETKVFSCIVKPWTDEEEVSIAQTALTWGAIRGVNVDQTNILYNLVLPTDFERGTAIEWSSSNEDVIHIDGTIVRPTYVQGDVNVVLTGVITKGTATEHVQFSVRVVRKTQTNMEAVEFTLSQLTASVILGENTGLSTVIKNLSLPKSITNQDARSVAISWTQVKTGTTTPSTFLVIDASTDPAVGIVTRPASTATSGENITLTATATSSSAAGDVATKTQVFNITIPKQTV